MLIRRAVPVTLAALLAAACSNPDAAKKAHFEKATRLAQQQRCVEAILEYRNAIQIDPRFGEARFGLAQCHEKNNEAANAYREYVRAADLLPQRADVQIRAARFLLRAQRFDDARTRAERALDIDPKSADAHIVLGSAIAGARDLAGAIDEIAQAIEIDPANAAGYASMGTLLLAQGRQQEAQAQFERAVAIAPSSIEALMSLAAYHWSVGSTKEAERIISRALAINGQDPLANRAMALLHIATGRIQSAEGYLKAAAASGSTDTELTLADYYVRTTRPELARPILERLAKADNGPAAVRLARLDYVTDTTVGHARIDGLLARWPSNSEALITKGRWLLRQGAPERALEFADRAAKADPGNAASHLLLGSVRAALGMNADAETAFAEVLRLNPRAASAQTALARLNLIKGHDDSAIQFARDAVTNAPARLDARILLVRSLLERRDLAQAAPELKKLTAVRPDNPTIVALNGLLKLQRGEFAGARRDFERAIALDPNDTDALGGLTTLDAREGQIARARQRIDGRLAGDPRSVSLLLLAARADFHAGDFQAGERRLRQASEIDPGNPRTYDLLGGMYMRQGRLDEARIEFEKMVQREPRSVAAHTMLGMIYQSMNRPNDAESAYQRAVQLDAGATMAANNLAYMLAERNDNLSYAVLIARDAAQRAPEDATILDTLGWVYYKQDQAKLAIAEFQKCVRLQPLNPTYQFHLGLAYVQAGDKEKGRRALEEALRLNPSFNGAAEAKRALASLQE